MYISLTLNNLLENDNLRKKGIIMSPNIENDILWMYKI